MRELKRQVRMMRYALEAWWGLVEETHPILRWLPQVAGDAITRYRVGNDGMTGEQRRSGRPWRRMVAEFGERVRFRPSREAA